MSANRRAPIAQPQTLDFRIIGVCAPELAREMLQLYSRGEVDLLLLAKVNTSDPRLSDARVPLPHHHAAADLDLSDKAGLGLDLTGNPDASTVSGLLGQALPSSMPDGFLKRKADNSGWEETDDVPDVDDFNDLKANFYKLLSFVVSTFGEVPEGLETAFEQSLEEKTL
jgi:hypothetical protein